MGAPAQPTLLPSPKGIAGPILQAVDSAEAQARLPNPLQQIAPFGAEVAQQLHTAEIKQQAKEDAIARSQARTSYFQQADQIFSDAETSDITSKEGFTALTKSLDELKQKTLESYPGSEEGRTALSMQLDDAHADYGRRAITARSKAVQQQMTGEVAATTNRLAARAYDTPSMLSDMLTSADAFLDDAAPAMNPQEMQLRRAEMHGDIAYSAIDGLLNRGDYREAELLSRSAGPMLTPQQQGAIDRRIRGLAADAAQIGGVVEPKMGPEGTVYHPETGTWEMPPPAMQQYLMGIKGAGSPKTSVSVDTGTKAREAFGIESAKTFEKELSTYRQSSLDAQDTASKVGEIDKLLKGVPTGTWSAEVGNVLRKQLNLSSEQVANREAADAATGERLLDIARKLAPVTQEDIDMLKTITAGSAQTPVGRAKIVYMAKRQADYNKALDQFGSKVRQSLLDNRMTESNARLAIDMKRQQLQDIFRQSWNPPRADQFGTKTND